MRRETPKVVADAISITDAGERPPRYQQLDGLRGIAAMVVVFAHFVIAFHPTLIVADPVHHAVSRSAWLSQSTLNLFWSPELAVSIFFVLSGFVLAMSVHGRPTFLVELVLRRWIRLGGPILLTSLVIWSLVEADLMFSGTFGEENGSEWLKMNFGWLARQSNDLRQVVFEAVFDLYVRGKHTWNSALWTIRVEFWGSIAIYCAYDFVGRFTRSARFNLAVACILFALAWQSNYGAFAAGAALFELGRLVPGGAARPALVWTGGLAVLLAGLLAAGMPYDPFETRYWPATMWLFSAGVANPVLSAHRMGAVLIVAAALIWLPLGRLLIWRPVRYLGRVSFAVYLCHPAILCSMASWLMLLLTPRVGYDAASVLVLPVFLATLFGVAEVVTRFFDEPSVKLARSAGRAVTRVSRELLPLPLSRALLIRDRAVGLKRVAPAATSSLIGVAILLAGTLLSAKAAVPVDGPVATPIDRVQTKTGARIVRCTYFSYGYALYHRFDKTVIYSIVSLGGGEGKYFASDEAMVRYLNELKSEAGQYCVNEANAGRPGSKLADPAQRIDLIGPEGRRISAFYAPDSRAWTWTEITHP